MNKYKFLCAVFLFLFFTSGNSLFGMRFIFGGNNKESIRKKEKDKTRGHGVLQRALSSYRSLGSEEEKRRAVENLINNIFDVCLHEVVIKTTWLEHMKYQVIKDTLRKNIPSGIRKAKEQKNEIVAMCCDAVYKKMDNYPVDGSEITCEDFVLFDRFSGVVDAEAARRFVYLAIYLSFKDKENTSLLLKKLIDAQIPSTGVLGFVFRCIPCKKNIYSILLWFIEKYQSSLEDDLHDNFIIDIDLRNLKEKGFEFKKNMKNDKLFADLIVSIT